VLRGRGKHEYNWISMKVVLIHITGLGGTQLYNAQLTNALSKEGNEVVVLLGDYLHNELHYPDKSVKIIRLRTAPSYLRMLVNAINPLMYHRILKMIEKEDPDVIHATFEDPMVGTILYLCKMKGKYPLFVTEHDPSFHAGEKPLTRLNFWICRLMTRRVADVIFVHGHQQKEVLESQGFPGDKIRIVKHGDYSYYTRWKGKDETIEKSILFFGSIQYYKGISYLIEAVPKIISAIPEVKVVIAGQGDLSKYKESLADTKHYEVHNRFIPDEEVAVFFQRAALVVLPYVDGSQSGIVPIAYAFKKPVVVTDVGSIPEVVDDGKTGIIVPPKNPDLLAEAIIMLLRDSQLLEQMGQNAYDKMKAELSWDNIASEITQVYRDISVRKM
jgi:starch synthase